MITRGAFVILAGGALAFAASCSDEAVQLGDDRIDNPEGFPFVTRAFLLSDLCGELGAQSCELARHPPIGATMVEITQPEPGRLCVQGNIGSGGLASFILKFTQAEPAGPAGSYRSENPLNADALGITQVSFEIDTPPKDGVTLLAATLRGTECTGTASACYVGGFALSSPVSNEVVSLTKSGVVKAPLVDFRQTNPQAEDDFDTSSLDGIYLVTHSAGAVDFCISDLKFLDSEGNEVTP